MNMYMSKKETPSYENESVNDLIIYGIYRISQGSEDCTFERLVKECFTLFSNVFSFVSYSNWPDSRKLDRPLRQLRKEKIITGDPKTSFILTKLGKDTAMVIEKRLRQAKLNLYNH